MQPAPTFGRRGTPLRASRPAAPGAIPQAHAAAFAAARAEAEETRRDVAVPRSVRAALLAGLVVGCCLAGLDATRAGATLRALSGGLLPSDGAPRLVPLVILLGLYGGARAAAAILLVAHAALRKLALTGHLAYAFGSAAVAGAISTLGTMIVQSGIVDAVYVPSHGMAIDVMAGAAAGILYRVLAGAAHVDSGQAIRRGEAE